MNRKLTRSSIDQPLFLANEVPINELLPSTSWANDDFGMASSGIGSFPQGVRANIGEFLERRHFCNCVLTEKWAPLHQAVSEEEYDEWLHALRQISNAGEHEIATHVFPLTSVRRIDGAIRLIPTASIRIYPLVGHTHNDFIPFRDTCGCSLHVNARLAVLGAVREQLERQCLLVFWLTGASGILIQRETIRLALGAYHPLYDKLCDCGSFHFTDITIPGCPGYAVLAVYRGSSRTIVKYCPGLSYDLDLPSAVQKAFLELWQNHNFLVAMNSQGANRSSITDRYHSHFLACNSLEIADEICGGSTEVYTARGLSTQFQASDIWNYLINLFPYSYLYLSKLAIGGHAAYAAKFLSPALFLHMDNSRGNNLDNRLFKSIGKALLPERAAKMVPFP